MSFLGPGRVRGWAFALRGKLAQATPQMVYSSIVDHLVGDLAAQVGCAEDQDCWHDLAACDGS